MSPPRGRFAPSPTGRMHLGNAFAALLAWLASRSRGGSMVLRLEDIDPARSRPEFEAGILDDLRWLGLDWDEGPDMPDGGGPHGPYRQSQRGEFYAAAVARLAARGLVYDCFCTRKELRALAGAPHAGDVGVVYPGTCARLDAAAVARRLETGRPAALRLRCPDEPVTFVDLLHGPITASPARQGDMALRRGDGVWAYALAVVADDGVMGVTQVTRGDDLLPVTASQVALFQLLGHAVPAFLHVPLLLDEQGERLAKRHGGFELAALREAGARPEVVVGWLAHAAGLQPEPVPTPPAALLAGFDPSRLRRDPVIAPADVATRLRRRA